MLTYAIALVLAICVAATATPLVGRFAHRYELFDLPTSARKIHSRAIPRIGGIAVAMAFFAPVLGLWVYTNDIAVLLYEDVGLVVTLLLGAATILGLGVWDDLKGAGARLKFTIQTLVAVGMWFAGFRIEVLGNPFGEVFQLGMLSLPVTALWIVGVINALNLIDGLDGLASGLALFASVVLFVVAFVDNAVLLCLFSAALAGALVGFLFFNFNPARIFLGDSGSMFIGFVLAVISIWTQRKSATAVALLIPIMALGVPLLDTLLCIVRRVVRRQNPFVADREHVHHRLLALGLSHRSAVYTLYALSLVFALGGLALLDNDTTRRTIALSTVVGAAVLMLRRTGVFTVPGVFASSRTTPRGQDEVRKVARAIRGARNVEQAWRSLVEILPQLSLRVGRLVSVDPGDGDSSRRSLEWVDSREFGQGSAKALEPELQEEDMLRLPLEEGGERFGELQLWHAKDASDQARRDRQPQLERLQDALIDFCVVRREAVRREEPAIPRAHVVVAPAFEGDPRGGLPAPPL